MGNIEGVLLADPNEIKKEAVASGMSLAAVLTTPVGDLADNLTSLADSS